MHIELCARQLTLYLIHNLGNILHYLLCRQVVAYIICAGNEEYLLWFALNQLSQPAVDANGIISNNASVYNSATSPCKFFCNLRKIALPFAALD